VTAEKGKISGDRDTRISRKRVAHREAENCEHCARPRPRRTDDADTEYLHVIPKTEQAETDSRDDQGAAWNNRGRRSSSTTRAKPSSSSPASQARSSRAFSANDLTPSYRACPTRDHRVRRRLFLAASVAMAKRRTRRRDRFFRRRWQRISQDTPGGTLKGNVVITQGTITIHADRIDFKQNPDNSMSATAYGNPISFRRSGTTSTNTTRATRSAPSTTDRRSSSSCSIVRC